MRLVHSRQYLEELGEDGEGGVLVVHALAVGHVGCVDLLARQDRAIPLLEVVGDPSGGREPAITIRVLSSCKISKQKMERRCKLKFGAWSGSSGSRMIPSEDEVAGVALGDQALAHSGLLIALWTVHAHTSAKVFALALGLWRLSSCALFFSYLTFPTNPCANALTPLVAYKT